MNEQSLNELFELIDKKLIANSSLLLLNEKEKNSLYNLKLFIDSELRSRIRDKKVSERLFIELETERTEK
jgi:hypothetical protein